MASSIRPPGRTVTGTPRRPRVPAIGRLDVLCCPSAVPGLVAPVPVDAVQGGAVRPGSHVLQERGEVPPPVAHTDPSPAVAGPRCVLGVVAAPQHRLPRPPRGVVRTLLRRPHGPCRRLPGTLLPDLRPRPVRVALPGHRMSHTGVVTRDVLRHPVPTFVNRCKLTAAAGARLRYQWLAAPAGSSTLSVGDPLPGLRGMMFAPTCHTDSVPTEGDEYHE